MSVTIDEVEASIAQNRQPSTEVEDEDTSDREQTDVSEKKCECVTRMKKRAARLIAD